MKIAEQAPGQHRIAAADTGGMQPGPDTLATLDLDALVGQSVEEARAAVHDAGGVLRAVAPEEPVTLEFRPDRVTVVVDDGRVVSHHGIG
jgi:Peptidase inhibitor I78 family